MGHQPLSTPRPPFLIAVASRTAGRLETCPVPLSANLIFLPKDASNKWRTIPRMAESSFPQRPGPGPVKTLQPDSRNLPFQSSGHRGSGCLEATSCTICRFGSGTTGKRRKGTTYQVVRSVHSKKIPVLIAVKTGNSIEIFGERLTRRRARLRSGQSEFQFALVLPDCYMKQGICHMSKTTKVAILFA